VLTSSDMPANAYNDVPLKEALKQLGITAPVGEIKGEPRKTVQ
jgi:hypothetical protein